jgi:hypothetical protein
MERDWKEMDEVAGLPARFTLPHAEERRIVVARFKELYGFAPAKGQWTKTLRVACIARALNAR